MIVSGFGQTRSVSGKGTFVIPGLQRVDTLALGAVQVQLSTENEIPTQDARGYRSDGSEGTHV